MRKGVSSRLSFIFRQPTMLAHLLLRSQAVGKEFPTRGGPTFPARQGDAEGASITAWEGIWQKRGYETLGAGLLIMLAVALRVLLIARGWPLLDSDEGTMGIMAIHIDRLGEHPFFFYGQAYMGATEAYLAAFFFHFFGVSTFSLRLGLVLIYVVFLVAMFFLTRMVYSGRFALVVLLLLALGSNAMLVRELVAVGGDPETLMSSALVMCLASWLALTAEERGRARPGGRRLLAYGGWGLFVGFGFFSHMLVAPFVLLSGLLILLFCWRELKSLAPLLILLGLVIGAAPLIIYNISLPEKSTLFYVLHAVSAGGTKPAPIEQLKGALLVSLPTATGANPLCSVSEAQTFNLASLHGWRCAAVHAGWSVGVVVLWCVATVWASVRLWSRWRRGVASWSPEERRDVVRYCVHLALLLGVAVTLVLYILSPNSALYPVATSRYLIGSLLATPALLWPLWAGLRSTGPLVLRWAGVRLRPGRMILAGLALLFLLGTFSTFTGVPAQASVPGEDIYFTQNSTQHLDVPATQELNQRESQLIDYLSRVGDIHIYSDYWTCNRLIFKSQEHIICDVLNDDLRPGHDRYLPYRALVNADPRAAYVLREGSQQDRLFQQQRMQRGYRRFVLAGYAIFERNL